MPTSSPPATRFSRLAPLATAGILLLPLAGCATGSSASFTQAPLIFAEQSAPDGVPTSATLATPLEIQASDPAAAGIGYVAIGGNAVLPVAALSTLTDALGATLPEHLPVAILLQISPADGATVAATLPVASLAVTAGLPTGPTLAPVSASLAASLPATSIAIDAALSTGSPGATAAAIVGPVSVALVTTQPILSGVTAQLATPGGSNLLTLSAGNLVRICLLKGCR